MNSTLGLEQVSASCVLEWAVVRAQRNDKDGQSRLRSGAVSIHGPLDAACLVSVCSFVEGALGSQREGHLEYPACTWGIVLGKHR